MKMIRFSRLPEESREALRLAAVQGLFWSAMAVGSYQTVYLQENGFPAAQFGLLNAVACGTAVLAMTFWGSVSDRSGSVKRTVVLTLSLGSLLYALVPLLPMGMSYTVPLFLVCNAAICFFRSPMAAFVDNITVRNCAEQHLNYGSIRSSGSLWYAVVCILVVQLLIPWLGVRSTFWVAGLVMIPTILLILSCREPQSAARAKRSRAGSGELVKNRGFLLLLIFGFFFYVAVAFEGNFLPYLMAECGIDSTNFGILLSVRAITEIPFLFFISRLRRRLSLRVLLMAATLLMGLECLMLGLFARSLTSFALIAVLFGLGDGLYIGAATNYVYELAPVHLRATAHGLFVSVAQIAGILGNLWGGVLFDAMGGKPFYLVAGVVMWISTLTLLLGSRFAAERNT